MIVVSIDFVKRVNTALCCVLVGDMPQASGGMKQLHHKYFVQGVKAFELTKPLSDFPADKDWEELQIVAARDVGNVGVTENIPFIEL